MARRAAEQHAVAYPRPVVDALMLLVSELVTNSVRHSGLGPRDSITLSVRLEPGRIRVEVTDGGQGFDCAGPVSDPDGNGSWGLRLVDLLSDRWGVRRDPFSIWLDLPANQRDGAAVGP
jgi:anti-sigma regulatory factor (Ser/Thr protein kinase)